jgi:hypothetical protein
MSAGQQPITNQLTAAGIVLLGATKLQLPKPGQRLADTNLIFITAHETVSRTGKGLGRALAFFGAPENLPGQPRNFNRNAGAIGDLSNWHSRNGWKHDRRSSGTSSYEEALFNALKDGSAIGKWTMPELALVNGKDRNRNTVSANENMLAFNQDRTSPFYNSFVTIPGSTDAEWSQSCTGRPEGEGGVRTVLFPDGLVFWDYKDNAGHRSCVRPVVALELNRATPLVFIAALAPDAGPRP